jgi:hypothetical protein
MWSWENLEFCVTNSNSKSGKMLVKIAMKPFIVNRKVDESASYMYMVFMFFKDVFLFSRGKESEYEQWQKQAYAWYGSCNEKKLSPENWI